MQKVSYMGDGSTTEFNFNFPYYESSNIIVTKNGSAATGYTLVGTSAGENADIPYTGGKIVFETAPTALDSITIARDLPLTRTVDYQPTAKINPTTLNQDLNYMMEVLKDFNGDLEAFSTQYSEIVNKESTTNLLEKIATVTEAITTVSAQITALGDITTIRESITTNTNDLTALKDASNLTATGKSTIAGLAMPGTQTETLTLGTTGSTYTAPADGYIYLNKTSTAAGQNITLINNDNGMRVSDNATSSGSWVATYLPVGKGQVVRITYTTAGTTNAFVFIHAKGA